MKINFFRGNVDEFWDQLKENSIIASPTGIDSRGVFTCIVLSKKVENGFNGLEFSPKGIREWVNTDMEIQTSVEASIKNDDALFIVDFENPVELKNVFEDITEAILMGYIKVSQNSKKKHKH